MLLVVRDAAGHTRELTVASRLDTDNDKRHYIGRIGIFDTEGDYEPLLMDWRAPAARAFYLATAAAQIVFLVLFSYAFFFEGYTGLTVTIGAVVTLFVLMQLTARVDWGQALSQRPLAAGR